MTDYNHRIAGLLSRAAGGNDLPRISLDHRSAPDHLRRWDPERLSDAARWLRQLVDMKATVAHREKRFTTRNTADAIATADRLVRVAHAQIESPIDIETRLRPNGHRQEAVGPNLRVDALLAMAEK